MRRSPNRTAIGAGILIALVVATAYPAAAQVTLGSPADPPRIDTDSGMPNSGGEGRPDFNFLTGLRE